MKRGLIIIILLLALAPLVVAQLTAEQEAALQQAQSLLASQGLSQEQIAAAQSALSSQQVQSLLASQGISQEQIQAMQGAVGGNVFGIGLSLAWPMIVLMIVLALAIYAYFCLAVRKLALKTSTQKEWLAWIPFAQFWLLKEMSKTPEWSFYTSLAGVVLIIVPSFISAIHYLAAAGWLTVGGMLGWWFIVISAMLGKPSWWGYVIASVFAVEMFSPFISISHLTLVQVLGILALIAGVLSLVFLGLLAWGETKTIQAGTIQPNLQMPLRPLPPILSQSIQPLQTAQGLQPLGPLPPLPPKQRVNANPALVAWIKENTASGFPAEQLKDMLIKQGFSEEEVNTAIQAARA